MKILPRVLSADSRGDNTLFLRGVPVTLSRGLMRDFSSIVQPLALAVFNTG